MSVRTADGVLLDLSIHHCPDKTGKGTILLVHGITVDKDEGGGMFIRLAHRLVAAGFAVVRFSFRGHGASEGTSAGVTIAGECLDLQAAVAFTREQFGDRFSVVAASFGAVAVTLSLPWMAERIDRLVLWNPVLDLRRTFLEPELPWGQKNFSVDQRRDLAETGVLAVDGEFELGRVLFTEFEHYRPLVPFLASAAPTSLIVHGDHDTAVSYDIAAEAARTRNNTDLHTISGSDHGFDSEEREDEAMTVTVEWLTAQAQLTA